jgi:hypothetical protein
MEFAFTTSIKMTKLQKTVDIRFETVSYFLSQVNLTPGRIAQEARWLWLKKRIEGDLKRSE